MIKKKLSPGSFDEIYSQYYKKFGMLSNIIPEFLAVKYGLKKAFSHTIESGREFNESFPFIKKLCADSKLWIGYVVSKRNHRDYNILVSNKKINIINDDEDENGGNRFSYPSCCVKAFDKSTHSYYFTNNIKKMLVGQDTFDFRMNPFLINYPFHLYTHLPCSLNCKKTLNYAAKSLDIMKEHNKLLYAHTVFFSKAIGLYLDICGMCLLFKGELADGQVNYGDFYPNKLYENRISQSGYDLEKKPILFNEIIQALSQGDNFTLKNNKLIIRKGPDAIRSFLKPSDLFWKVVNFT
jgi:hypothetical protein